MISATLSPSVGAAFRPRLFVSTAEWAPENITLPKNSELRGKFRLDLFPHAREPLDAFDDPAIRSITLQWGSRLGKTFIILACLAKTAACDPHPMAFADADEKSTTRVIKRLWKVLEKVPALQDQLPPRRLRSQQIVELRDCVVYGAWSGSPATAADYAAQIVALNEIDKMTRRQSDEADFAYLMEERCKGFRKAKILRGSTPSLKGESRVETFRLAGDNRARLVPCPRCNHWQMLRTGNGEQPGGLRWEKPSSGRSDPAIALETAWYECEACQGRIENEERYALMNAGRWVREGQTISGSGRIAGNPSRPGPDASFGPLSTLYSLLPSITWGTVAKAFLDSRGHIERRRNYHNSWEGLTWDPAPPAANWQDLAKRLCDPAILRGTAPEWARFLTVGVDVQDHGLPWIVCAWGEGCRCAVIDWGFAPWGPIDATNPTASDELKHLRADVLDRLWPHADGGPPLRVAYTLIDSGDQAPRIYALCDQLRQVDPCKGSSTEFREHFRLGERGGRKSGHRNNKRLALGQSFVEINTRRTQEWVEDNLSREIRPGMFGCLQLAGDAALEPELLEEFLNETRRESINEAGQRVEQWVRCDTHRPNDHRDCLRYAWTAAQVVTNHGKLWNRLPDRTPPAAPSSRRQTRAPLTTPDGRPFLITDR